jgi:hypothetical protein
VEGSESNFNDVLESGKQIKVDLRSFILFSLIPRGGRVSTHCLGGPLQSTVRRMSTSKYETPNWPASPEHLSAARQFLKSISTKPDDRPVLIIPDRDVDGLTSGGIMQRVISRVLLKERRIDVQTRFVSKGASINDLSEKVEIDAVNAR